VIYYSNGKLPEPLKWFCLRTLAKGAASAGGELICITWDPLDLPGARNIIWPHHALSHRNLYEQILAGISEAKTDSVALAEHDVLYPEGYHEALLAAAGAGACFNTNLWRLNSRGFFRDGNSRLLSNYGGGREVVLRRIEDKSSEARCQGGVICAEPEGDSEIRTPLPTVDIRHGTNFTGEREPPDGVYSKTVEYWGSCQTYTRLFTSYAASGNKTHPHTPAASVNQR